MGVIPDCIPDYTVLVDQVEKEIDARRGAKQLRAPISRQDWCASFGKHRDERCDNFAANPAVEAGHRRWEKLQWALENNGYQRSASQKELHLRYSYATLPKLYGSEVFESHQFEILQYHKLDRVRYEVLCLAPRRFGKTFSVAMFIAAYLIACVECNLPVFSPGQRASSSMQRLVIKMLRRIPGFTEQFDLKISQEKLTITPKGDKSKERCAFFYPSSKKGLRGVNADIIILEEAAYLDLGVFFEVIVPLMGMQDTVLIGISTPDGKINFYSDLINMVDENGQPYFNVYHLSLVCDACKRNFADSIEKLTECPHNQHLLPPWKGIGRAQMLHKLMESRPELYMQEVQGEMVAKTTACFPHEYIDKLRERPRYVSKVDFKVRHWFAAVDPTGGGASRFAMGSGFWGPSQELVVRTTAKGNLWGLSYWPDA